MQANSPVDCLIAEHRECLIRFLHVGDNTGDGLKSGLFRSLKPAVADDDEVHILIFGIGNDGQVLEDAIFLDAGGKLGDACVGLADVVRVVAEVADADFHCLCHSRSFLSW